MNRKIAIKKAQAASKNKSLEKMAERKKEVTEEKNEVPEVQEEGETKGKEEVKEIIVKNENKITEPSSINASAIPPQGDFAFSFTAPTSTRVAPPLLPLPFPTTPAPPASKPLLRGKVDSKRGPTKKAILRAVEILLLTHQHNTLAAFSRAMQYHEKRTMLNLETILAQQNKANKAIKVEIRTMATELANNNLLLASFVAKQIELAMEDITQKFTLLAADLKKMKETSTARETDLEKVQQSQAQETGKLKTMCAKMGAENEKLRKEKALFTSVVDQHAGFGLFVDVDDRSVDAARKSISLAETEVGNEKYEVGEKEKGGVMEEKITHARGGPGGGFCAVM